MRSGYRGQGSVLVQLPEQHPPGADQLGHALGQPAVEIAERRPGPRVIGHDGQRLERQPMRLFDAKRRLGARLAQETLLFAAIEVGSHVDQRLDQLLPPLLQARHLHRHGDLVGQDGDRPALDDRVYASPRDAHHADHLAAGRQWHADVVVQAMIWHEGGSSGPGRALRGGSEQLVDFVAG